MKKLVNILLPILVVAGASGIAFVTIAKREVPERRPPHRAAIEVEVTTLAQSDFTVRVKSRGTVRPRTESSLIPEVSGRVVSLSPNIREGEFFEAGEVLLEIDPRDYQAEIAVVKANIEQAHMTLAEEQARAEQARRDWKRLGETGVPDALVLRKPQLAGARAAVTSAEARLTLARLALERTKIVAPYAGRVLERNVDIGQYVTPGTVLVRIYAVDYVEVRLPLTNRQLEFVDIPEVYRDDSLAERREDLTVRLSARIGSRLYTWDGRVVRAEGSIDTQSRQLFVIAQVDDPYGKGPAGRPPLKVGQFVEAEIAGRRLADVVVIPRSALRAGGEVLLVNDENRLETRAVEVLWSNEQSAVTGSGLAAGERLVLTPLGGAMDGIEVRVRDVANSGEPVAADSDDDRSKEAAGHATPGSPS
ncbi:MAG: efflux RND transporter periplasmic adaptor subunit [Gammaproteobacteria bacterium]|nr:MAG: efflux RND transporter periplasmic adaptor subunit [Gammaproteobacteria bacterium]